MQQDKKQQRIDDESSNMRNIGKPASIYAGL